MKSSFNDKIFLVFSLFILISMPIILNVSTIAALILPGDASYGSTNTNITQETGFSHLTTNDSSLIFYMPFDVNTTIARDYTPNDNDGTLNGGIKWNSTGFIGGAYDFDGVNDYIDLGDKDAFSFTDGAGNDRPFSFTMWAKHNSPTESQVLAKTNAGNSNNPGEYSVAFNTFPSPAFAFSMRQPDPSVNTYIRRNATFTPVYNKWYFLAGTYDGSETANGIKIYMNGVEVGMPDSGGTYTGMSNTAVPLYIGARQLAGAPNLFVNGTIDEVMIFNRALNNSEILSIYNNQSSRFYPRGEQLFQNINLGTDNIINLSIKNCNILKGSYLAMRINNHQEANLTNCTISNYTIPSIENRTNANLTMIQYAGTNNSYTPNMIGNITITGQLTSATDTNVTQETGFSHLNISDADIKLYMPFDVNTATTKDYTPNDNDGTLNGVTWNSAGLIGGAYDFDGVNDDIRLSNDALDSMTDGTIAGWVKFNSIGSIHTIFTSSSLSSAELFTVFGINSAGKLYAQTRVNSVNQYLWNAETTIFEANKWYQITWSKSGSNHNASINGVQQFMNFTVDVNRDKYFNAVSSGTTGYTIGQFRRTTNANYLNGTIDDFQIYGVGLNSTEMLNLYNNQSSRFYLRGEQLFRTFNFGRNNTLNLSLNNCNTLKGAYLTMKINNGPEANFTNCAANNYDLSSAGNLTSANLTIAQYAGTNNFYTPEIIGEFSWITADTIVPQIEFVSPTPANYTGVSGSFIINATIIDANPVNVVLNWNGTITTFSVPNESIVYLGGNNYLFTYNQTGLITENIYYYNLTVSDIGGNKNRTETRLILGNAAPSFYSVIDNPSRDNLLDIDPGVNISITANISDSDNNFLGDAILQWKNQTGTFGENNITLVQTTPQGYTNNILAGSFVLPAYENNFTYRIVATDELNSTGTSNNFTLQSFWDCSWNSTLDLGSTAGWDQNKFIGNITINNTGDPQFAIANCSLDFRVSYSLAEGRVYYDGEYIKNIRSYTINTANTTTISINSTFLSELSEEDFVITLEEYRLRSDARYRNTTATIVSVQQGPYLSEKITSAPSSVFLTPGDFSVQGYVRNLMGSADFNENNTAYNVSFYWNLPGGLTNSSGSLNITFDNINTTEFNYMNTNLTFENLASMTSGVKTFYLHTFGYNLSNDLIRDAFGNTILNKSVNITFSCYNVSDGVYVSSCGSLDGDYVAPTTTVTTGGGGGGGGEAALKETVKTSADLQLVRGKENEIKVLFENKNHNLSMTNLAFSVSGDIAKYIQVIPSSLTELSPLQKINITLKITSPTYIGIGRQTITLRIEGKLGDKTYEENKKITLEIHEISQSEAESLLNRSIGLMKELESKNLSSQYLSILLSESMSVITDFNFEKVQENYRIIAKEVANALSAKEIIEELTPLIALAKEKGIGVSDSERILKLSLLALNRGEFEQAFLRAKEAQVTYALETKRELGTISYYLKNYPGRIALTALFIALLSFGIQRTLKIRMLGNKIKKLKEEEAILVELMKAVQKETFKDKTMTMEEYSVAMKQYEKRLSEAIEQIINLESERAHALKFGRKEKMLKAEKERLIKLIKHLQDDYFRKKRIETRSYEVRIESYNRRIGEIEEKLATLEAKAALGRIFGIFGPKTLEMKG